MRQCKNARAVSVSGLCETALVPRHRGFDRLIFDYFRTGKSSGATRSSMLRGTPGSSVPAPCRLRPRRRSSRGFCATSSSAGAGWCARRTSRARSERALPQRQRASTFLPAPQPDRVDRRRARGGCGLVKRGLNGWTFAFRFGRCQRDADLLCAGRSQSVVHSGIRGRMCSGIALWFPAGCMALRRGRSHMGRGRSPALVQASAPRLKSPPRSLIHQGTQRSFHA
jgi:hypothetical protein